MIGQKSMQFIVMEPSILVADQIQYHTKIKNYIFGVLIMSWNK